MSKSTLKVLTGIIAVALAICAAYFSIIGLAKLFAGAATAVIIMASILEASKLVIASFLYQTWSTVSKSLKAYLLVAIVIIAMITSIGIYGFLSGAYQTTKNKYDLVQTTTDSLKAKKQYYELTLASTKSILGVKSTQLASLSNIRNSQEQRATQLVNNNKSSRSADKSAKQTDQSLNEINKEINKLNDRIISYSDSVSNVQVLITQSSLKNDLSSELGSLAYISKITNIPMDNVVNILIILFIIVFDPLAICMVLAFNFLNTKNHKSIENTPKENEPIIDVEETPIISEITAEIPSEQPLEQSNPEPLDIDITEPNLESIIMQEKIAKKVEKAKQMYSGAVSPNNQSEVKNY